MSYIKKINIMCFLGEAMNIHYFQRYNQKENVASANTMLLLSRLYFYSSDKFLECCEALSSRKSRGLETMDSVAIVHLDVSVTPAYPKRFGFRGTGRSGVFRSNQRIDEVICPFCEVRVHVYDKVHTTLKDMPVDGTIDGVRADGQIRPLDCNSVRNLL